VPRGGTKDYALDFARRHSRWIEDQLRKNAARAQQARPWSDGTEVLFRGEARRLSLNSRGDVVQLADQHIAIPAATGDVRPFVEAHLWALAEKELVPRTWQMAAEHQLQISRVRVRNQRSRWGSCSVRGTICLNWRLIQAPLEVRDYLIIHELMHLREMNHSARFWKCVQTACPNYHKAEQWLDNHSDLLRPARGERPAVE
jgi:predicted metal-dependent hydrolase